MMLRECVLLVTVCVFGVGSLSGRGFFCRDPDTGKLHPANSTWTASTFCGKYHCKLKRKNITSSNYAPLRQINITNVQLLGQNLTSIDTQKKGIFLKNEEAENSVVSTDSTIVPDTIDSNNTLKDQGITLQDIIDDKNTSDKDRYLSEKEIKSLTEVLHTLKKGDLEAIVEIYNLAQDIYKELDKTSTNHVLQEASSTAETLNKQIFKSDMFEKMTKHASYWYEPLSSGKIKVADMLRPDVIRTDINPEIPPIATGLDLPATVNVIPKPTPINVLAQMSLIPPIPTFQLRKNSDSFFNGPLTYKDFGKLPYYYPISNFQRMSSYRKQEQNKKITVKEVTPAPVPFRPPQTLATSPVPVPVPNSIHKTITNKTIHIGGKYQKELSPSIFLPYPFTNMQHYNWSLPQSIYHRNKVDTRRKEESLFDKLELLRRDENLYGTRRKEEYSVDQLVKRRKQENLFDKLELLTKEENLFNQLGTRREEKNFINQLTKRGKHEDILDKLELLTKEENLFDQLGPRRKEEKLSGKLEIRRNDDTSNKNTITIKKSKDKKSNAILMNPDLENFQDLQISSSLKEDNTVKANVKQEKGENGRKLIERRRPEWQTDSLPQQILDEVRAHIQEKQRLFIHPVPLRKKVKLERVAKLLNMDAITRTKRSEEQEIPTPIDAPLEPELYEVYIESTTCHADYEIPGYFRYGNLSQPFPECCPQRLPTR